MEEVSLNISVTSSKIKNRLFIMVSFLNKANLLLRATYLGVQQGWVNGNLHKELMSYLLEKTIQLKELIIVWKDRNLVGFWNANLKERNSGGEKVKIIHLSPNRTSGQARDRSPYECNRSVKIWRDLPNNCQGREFLAKDAEASFFPLFLCNWAKTSAV